MRDGKKLAVDILKVTDGKKYPVILELTPYGRFLFLFNFILKSNWSPKKAGIWVRVGFLKTTRPRSLNPFIIKT